MSHPHSVLTAAHFLSFSSAFPACIHNACRASLFDSTLSNL